MEEGDANRVHAIAQPRQQRGQDGQGSDHGDRDDHDRRHCEGAERLVAGQEHAGHGDHHRQARDEHRSAGGRRGSLERCALAASRCPLLAFPLQVEEGVVDPDREPDQQHDRAHVLVDRPDLARQREQTHRRQHAREREQERDARCHQCTEGDDQDDDRDRKRQQARASEILADAPVDLLVRSGLAEAADVQLGMSGLRCGDGVDDGADPLDRRLRVAPDVERDESRTAVLRDQLGVHRGEWALDPSCDARCRDPVDHVRDGCPEARALHVERAALQEDALLRRLVEPGVEDPRHAAGFTGAGFAVRQLLGADGPAQDDGRDHERDPAEGRGLPVVGAPARRASCEIELHDLPPIRCLHHCIQAPAQRRAGQWGAPASLLVVAGGRAPAVLPSALVSVGR